MLVTGIAGGHLVLAASSLLWFHKGNYGRNSSMTRRKGGGEFTSACKLHGATGSIELENGLYRQPSWLRCDLVLCAIPCPLSLNP